MAANWMKIAGDAMSAFGGGGLIGAGGAILSDLGKKKKKHRGRKDDDGGQEATGMGLGSFKTGTPRVRKTGPYKLHAGEAVLNKRQATKMRRARVKRSGKR